MRHHVSLQIDAELRLNDLHQYSSYDSPIIVRYQISSYLIKVLAVLPDRVIDQMDVAVIERRLGGVVLVDREAGIELIVEIDRQRVPIGH